MSREDLFLKNGIYLHPQAGQNDDRSQRNAYRTVDDTFIPNSRIFHTSTKHEDETETNQSTPNTNIQVVLLLNSNGKD